MTVKRKGASVTKDKALLIHEYQSYRRQQQFTTKHGRERNTVN
jgi:hypothetical protein